MYYGPIDLRKEIKTLIDLEGFHWIALRSVDLSRPCSKCKDEIDPQYSDVSIQCSVCLGIGYSYIDKLTKGYGFRGATAIDQRTNVVMINTENIVWVLQHNIYPKNSDYILELDLDESTGIPKQPFSIIKAYKIQDAQSMLGDDRRIEFWSCYTEESNIDLGRSST
jgi:hypothetical protein